MIPKTQTPTSINDFRPISLLEVPGKILEKIIKGRVNDIIERAGLYNNYQFGFWKKRSTQTAILLGIESVANGLQKSRKVRVVLRDISKAFDKIWHTGLKFKINKLPLSNAIKHWLFSFLDRRTAVLRGYTGDRAKIELNAVSLKGVPYRLCYITSM